MFVYINFLEPQVRTGSSLEPRYSYYPSSVMPKKNCLEIMWVPQYYGRNGRQEDLRFLLDRSL